MCPKDDSRDEAKTIATLANVMLPSCTQNRITLFK